MNVSCRDISLIRSINSFSFFPSSVIAWLIIPMDSMYVSDTFYFKSWNLFVALCALPSLMLGLWLFAFPESPKFLLECGETDAALEVFKWIYAQNTGESPDSYPVILSFIITKTREQCPPCYPDPRFTIFLRAFRRWSRCKRRPKIRAWGRWSCTNERTWRFCWKKCETWQQLSAKRHTLGTHCWPVVFNLAWQVVTTPLWCGSPNYSPGKMNFSIFMVPSNGVKMFAARIFIGYRIKF